MNKFVIVPDSFKGTMSSIEVCGIMRDAVLDSRPGAQVRCIPVADGGEGTVDCFLTAMGGERIVLEVSGPFGEPVQAFYGMLQGGSAAVIEMAACAGLPLVENNRNPMRATTYGVGQLMLDAASRGAKKLLIGLGGSATNDGGCGAAAAAGVRFYNAEGKTFVPSGGSLKDIARIDTSGLSEKLRGIEILAMCDIDNPMYGDNGAAYVFAPQKGADKEAVKALDLGLRHLAQIMRSDLGLDVADIPGSGAAGAMGAGMPAFFNAKLRRGIDVVLETVGFDDILSDADLVFTGEGKFDSQSLQGKVIYGVSKRAKAAKVPVVVVAGAIDDGVDAIYKDYVTSAFAITRTAAPLREVRHKSRENLRYAMDNILSLLYLADKR